MEKVFKIFLFVALFASFDCYVSYRNHKLYDVTPTADQFEAFRQWEYESGFDFFKLVTPGRTSNVLVAPERQQEFEKFLSQNNILYSIDIEDYEEILEKERNDIVERRKHSRGFDGRFGNFSVYWTFEEIEAWCTQLAAKFPQFVHLETLAFSPENRRIFAMKVSTSPANFGSKPIYAVEAGMHAREWVSAPTALYLLHKLVEDPATRNELLARVDWLIIPMQNPDGYVFSWTDNRMWRQNRRQITPTCIGADLNRNWPFTWQAATIAQPCGSLTFPGPFPLSEPENFALNQLNARYNSRIIIYMTVHSFGDLIVFPWSVVSPPWPLPNTPYHFYTGEIFRQAVLEATGKDYLVINTVDFFGNVHGVSHDHAIGANNATVAHTLELTSGFNFVYPEERILALVEETFVGYRALGLHIGANYQ